MGRYYGLKIRSGEMTLEQVPKLWKKVTEKWLKENPEKSVQAMALPGGKESLPATFTKGK